MAKPHQLTYRTEPVDLHLLRDVAERLVGHWVVIWTGTDWKGGELVDVHAQNDNFAIRLWGGSRSVIKTGIWRIHKESLFNNPIRNPQPRGIPEFDDSGAEIGLRVNAPSATIKASDNNTPKEGERKMATAKTKAKGKAAATNGTRERLTESQKNKLAAQIVKLRDTQGKSWAEIGEITGIESGGTRRSLYNFGGGQPRPRAANGSTSTKSAPKGKSKTAAKGKAPAAKGGRKVVVKRGRGKAGEDPS